MGDVRQARAGDHDAVAAVTENIWSDRGVGDYIPDVFPEWVTSDGSDQRTVVATAEGEPVGICQALVVTDEEAWLQGMRVHPDHRDAAHGEAMATALLSWCHERGASVARNLVFGWNSPGMGQSRALGFDPVTACRWVRSVADAAATPDAAVVDDPAVVWRYWTHSDARDALSGLARATDEAWALSELDRDRLDRIGTDGRMFALVDDGTQAMAARLGTRERDGEPIAEYAVGAWDDVDAACDLFAAIRSDAAACGAAAARVLVPDTPRFVSDAAAARCEFEDTTDYVFATDLTDAGTRD